jgi:hypothetical protein
MLRQSEAIRHAHQLMDVAGPRAEAIAAQRAVREKVEGHRDAAEDWEKIRKVIRLRNGPRQT